MKLLFLDCETTGLCDWNKPADDPAQPRLASLAAILCEDERVISTAEFLVKPFGWKMPVEASAINGLTDDILNAYGVSIEVVLRWWNDMLNLDPLVVAHNVRFDLKVLRGEMRRFGFMDRFGSTRKACTMRMSSGGFGGQTHISLAAAVKHFLGEEMVNAHQAKADVEYCRRLYLAIAGVEVPALVGVGRESKSNALEAGGGGCW